MRLADVLKEEYIFADLRATEKRAILDEMVTGLSEGAAVLNRERVLEVLLDREQLGSTGIGHGVAIPHGKLKGLDEIIIAVGRNRAGVDFDSLDDLPVYLFFMIVAPENSAASHLKLLAAISHLLKNQEFRMKLRSARDAAEMYSLIVSEDRTSGIT
jgi:PTS system nitrogen regulatory IIA component